MPSHYTHGPDYIKAEEKKKKDSAAKRRGDQAKARAAKNIKKNIKTPDNFGFGDMPADYRMRYLKMIEQHNKDKLNKKQKKK